MIVNKGNLEDFKDDIDPKNETTVSELVMAASEHSYDALVELDKLLNNHGVETEFLSDGSQIEYSNTGDIYTMTIVLIDGELKLACLADYLGS